MVLAGLCVLPSQDRSFIAMETTKLRVVGIRCDSCSGKIERALGSLPGIRNVQTDVARGTVRLTAEPGHVDRGGIATALKQLGYDVVTDDEVLDADALRAKPRARTWWRSLAVMPAAVLSLLPSATCPACVAAYAGVLSAFGLGFLFDAQTIGPIIGAFLVTGILSVATSIRIHRRRGPLVASLVGATGIVAGRLAWSVPPLTYAGAAILIGASLWNLWLKRPRWSPLRSPSA